MTETVLQNRILRAVGSLPNVRLFRNETAGAWVGRVIDRDGGTVTLAAARMIQAGLVKGSADLIGIRDDGRFIAIEVKVEGGRTSPEQRAFIDTIRRFNGLAGVARSVEDALTIIRGEQCG